jgi:hypothetical protein
VQRWKPISARSSRRSTASSLTDSEFERLLDSIITPDVFAAPALREINSFERDDGTPLYYTLVNIKDWCKNTSRWSTSYASTPTTAITATT